MDHATAAAGFSFPGIDPRGWLSFGSVAPDSPDARSVSFEDEDGNPLPFPIVAVVLQPSGTTVACRVASQGAGAGEGGWRPFLAGDEVVVGIPHGDERGGCVILGRVNNAADPFPTNVGGANPADNKVAFDRMRTPYILEVAQGYLVRNASTGAQFGIDQSGQVIMNDGDGTRIFLGADAAAITSISGDASIQIINQTDVVSLAAGDGTSSQMGSDASIGLDGWNFMTPGTINMGSAGLPGSGHAVTLEQVINLFIGFIYLLNTAAPSMALVSTILNPSGFPGPFVAAIKLWLQSAVSTKPPTPTVAGGEFTLFGLPQLIATTLATQTPDPAALGLPIPVLPGIGRGGFLL